MIGVFSQAILGRLFGRSATECIHRTHFVIPSASKKALTARFRSLETVENVVRRDLSATVLHVECEFAAEMQHLTIALLDHLAAWGEFFESKRSSGQLSEP